jgi:hypothetical protein
MSDTSTSVTVSFGKYVPRGISPLRASPLWLNRRVPDLRRYQRFAIHGQEAASLAINAAKA